MVVRGVSDGAYWQVMTSVFTHVEVLHIGFNMLALYFLGPMLEVVLGRARFLAVYLVSGLVGSAAVMWFSDPNTPTLGASGAIFGLMGAIAVLALKVGGQAQSVLGWIGINLVLTFTLGGISWQGHLGGLLGGVVLGAAMVYAPRAAPLARAVDGDRAPCSLWPSSPSSSGRGPGPGSRREFSTPWGKLCGELQPCN